MQSLLKGFLISIVLLFGFGIFFFQFGIEGINEVGVVALLIPAFPIIGLSLGYAAKKIKTKRFIKLLLLGLSLVYLISILLSIILIVSDNSEMIKPMEMPSSIFFLSSVGFFIYGIAIFPFLALGVFFLERWTRTTE